MKISVLPFAFCLLIATASAQPASDSLNYPRIGRPLPEFVLRHIKYFSKTQALSTDFKGKWLLLSFWNKKCAGCVASFPEENRWFHKYSDRMQFISVAIQDPQNEIEPMFERYKKSENLNFPVSFDSLLASRWDIFAGPYFLLVDPDGIVRQRAYMTEHLLEQFLDGKSPKVPPVGIYPYDFENDPLMPNDHNKPFLVNNNGGRDDQFSYRSLISEFDCTTQHDCGPTEDDKMKNTGQFSMIGWPILFLYNYAFFGSLHPPSNEFASTAVEIRSKDSILFKYADYIGSTCENAFSYNLNMPPSKINKEKVMKIMRQDLENYFGFSAGIEERAFSGWKLLALDKNKLKSKGGKKEVRRTSTTQDYFARNISWDDFLNDFRRDGFREFIDSTGITGNIDINLRCSFVIRQEKLDALRANGLAMVPVSVTKKVLVIRDVE